MHIAPVDCCTFLSPSLLDRRILLNCMKIAGVSKLPNATYETDKNNQKGCTTETSESDANHNLGFLRILYMNQTKIVTTVHFNTVKTFEACR